MDVVYARREEQITTEWGGIVVVPLGSHWDAEDPLVRKHPGLFSDDPAVGLASSVHVQHEPRIFVGPDVEQATAAPGERRNARRPRNGE